MILKEYKKLIIEANNINNTIVDSIYNDCSNKEFKLLVKKLIKVEKKIEKIEQKYTMLI